ncbi:MAG: hypothetical protein EOO25_09485 [Comamonadaceae bacterium]|nr:MAG: hypothetical protein EOO25_09485 [Comamonadaceae bacterium]
MLLQLITQHPQAVGTVLRNTPTWVWGLLAALTWLGLTQLRDRSAGMARVTLMPVAMTVFSVWGTFSAFGASPQFGAVLATWFSAAAAVAALLASTRAPATYDAGEGRFFLKGSWVPLVLILGIFLTKYVVGVELAMQPQLARESQFAMVVGTLYGVFNGLFAGRAIRLLRLAMQPRTPARSPAGA